MNNFNGGSSSMGGYGGLKSNTGFGSKGNSTGGSLKGDKIPKGYEQGQLQQFSPEQMSLFQQMFGHLGPDSFLSKLAMGDEDQFEQMEAPAHRQFQGQLGQIASRFSQGGTGGRRGSGFQNTTTAAASNFSQDLASKRQELSRQALSDLMGFSNQLLGQRPQDRFLVEKPQQQNPWADIAGQFAGAIPGAVASYMNPLSGLTNAATGVAKY
jgi:hypothetical protein